MPEDLQERVDRLSWYHTIDLGGGVVTPGRFHTLRHSARYRLPERLEGKSVIDVGTANGFFAIEAARRGAARVVAVDEWPEGSAVGLPQFNLAVEAAGVAVEPVRMSVYDLEARTVGTFDLVFFCGLLYHLRHPLLGLERGATLVASGGTMIVETHVDLLDIPEPAARFFPGRELNRDPSNFWGPNPAAVEGMLAAAGLAEAEAVSFYAAYADGRSETFAASPGEPMTALMERARTGGTVVSGRVVYHARTGDRRTE